MLSFLDTGAPLKSNGDPATSGGVVVTAGASANTKGSYVELIAATEFDACGFMVQIRTVSSTARYAIDVSIGAAASEVAIAENLFMRASGSYPYVFIPVFVPAGSRISARSQSDSASAIASVAVTMIAAAGPQVPFLGSRVQSYGVDFANTDGTFNELTSYTAHVKGPWIQMSAAVADDVYAAMLASAYYGTDILLLLDIGIGGSGSEVAILTNLPFALSGNIQAAYTPWFPLFVPKGERLSIRFQSSVVGSDKFPDFILYGVH